MDADRADKPEKRDGRGWIRRTLDDLRGRGEDGDVIVGYVEEGADRVAIGKDIVQSDGDARAGAGERRIAIGKNIIQIGTLVVPTVPVLAVLGVVVSALIFGAVNFMGPAKMPGDFNIAVAEIGELDAQGRVRPSEDGALLSRWMFNELVAANEAYGDSNLVIWHDSLSLLDKRVKLGTISGQKPKDRADAAADLAERVGADVVVYGHLTPPSSPADLVMEFNVRPSMRAEANVTIGRYQLGQPIPVPEPFDATDTLAKEALSSRVTGRAEALFWLLLGLRDDLLGRSQQALATFRQAEAELEVWREEPGGGSEILYFFIGRSALFLGEYEEAEAALQEALRIDPTYARAKIVLAGVDFRRVQDLLHPPDGRAFQAEDVEPALAGVERAILVYQEGLELARESPEPLVEMIARLALASAYRMKGEIYFWLQEDAEANRFFERAIEEIQVVLVPLEEAEQVRILAQAHLYLGAAYTQQAEIARKEGRVEDSRALYEKAQAAYATCVAQEREAPNDDILRERIIADSCQPWGDYVEEVLLTLP